MSLPLNFAPESDQNQPSPMYEPNPFSIQPARILSLVPPREPSMFRSRNAPGPTFSRSRVVDWSKHGQPPPESIGCERAPPIGATYLAWDAASERALAVAPICWSPTPKTLEK